MRGNPEKFADHYIQATLFYESQTLVEKAHIAAAFHFELSKVAVPAIRECTVSMLRNASQDLAQKVVDGLGMETLLGAMPLALADPAKPEATVSPPLSLMARRRHERDGHTMEFIKDRYRHCKPIMVLGASKALLDKVGVPTTLPDGKADAGLIIVPTGSMGDAAATFIQAIGMHRHPLRETDPPMV